MRDKIRHHVASIILGINLLGLSFQTIATPPNQDLVSKTNDIITEYMKDGWFAGTVLIKRDGKIIYQRSVGYADEDTQIPNTPNTKIRIGSINKHYTAVLILQKAQAGELSLNDTLAKFELGFPTAVADKITIRHLLQHRSGFADIFVDEYIETYRSLLDIDDKLPLLMNRPLISTPGEVYHYSNYGYIVLGAILEKLENKPFRQILDQQILKPIGAQNTDYALTDKVTGKARSYHFTDEGRKVDKTGILENVTPDGGIYATAMDVALFYSKLFYSDVLLTDDYKAILDNNFVSPYLSWDELLLSKKVHWRSYGGGPGVSSAAEILISDGLIVIVLANTDGLVAERISQKIVSSFRGNG